MRNLALGVVLIVGLGGAASAQAPALVPQQITPQAEINLVIGQATTLRFPTAIKEVQVVTERIVRAIPQSDRVLTLLGLAPGQTMLLVSDDRNNEYTALVTVAPDVGRAVRLYGTNPKSPDYIERYCTATSCGRADLDKPKPSSTQQTVIEHTRGGSVSTTHTYP